MYSVIDVMDKLDIPFDRVSNRTTRLSIDSSSFEQSGAFGLPP